MRSPGRWHGWNPKVSQIDERVLGKTRGQPALSTGAENKSWRRPAAAMGQGRLSPCFRRVVFRTTRMNADKQPF